jgi:hypothetical protein
MLRKLRKKFKKLLKRLKMSRVPVPEAEGAAVAQEACGRKRKNAISKVDASEPTTKVSQISEAQVAGVEQEVERPKVQSSDSQIPLPKIMFSNRDRR